MSNIPSLTVTGPSCVSNQTRTNNQKNNKTNQKKSTSESKTTHSGEQYPYNPRRLLVWLALKDYYPWAMDNQLKERVESEIMNNRQTSIIYTDIIATNVAKELIFTMLSKEINANIESKKTHSDMLELQITKLSAHFVLGDSVAHILGQSKTIKQYSALHSLVKSLADALVKEKVSVTRSIFVEVKRQTGTLLEDAKLKEAALKKINSKCLTSDMIERKEHKEVIRMVISAIEIPSSPTIIEEEPTTLDTKKTTTLTNVEAKDIVLERLRHFAYIDISAQTSIIGPIVIDELKTIDISKKNIIQLQEYTDTFIRKRIVSEIFITPILKQIIRIRSSKELWLTSILKLTPDQLENIHRQVTDDQSIGAVKETITNHINHLYTEWLRKEFNKIPSRPINISPIQNEISGNPMLASFMVETDNNKNVDAAIQTIKKSLHLSEKDIKHIPENIYRDLRLMSQDNKKTEAVALEFINDYKNKQSEILALLISMGINSSPCAKTILKIVSKETDVNDVVGSYFN